MKKECNRTGFLITRCFLVFCNAIHENNYSNEIIIKTIISFHWKVTLSPVLNNFRNKNNRNRNKHLNLYL